MTICSFGRAQIAQTRDPAVPVTWYEAVQGAMIPVVGVNAHLPLAAQGLAKSSRWVASAGAQGA